MIICQLIISVSKSELLLNKRLIELENKANSIKNIEELNEVSKDFIKLKNDCWHKLHGTQLVVIKTILELKYKCITAKKTSFDFDI